MRELIFVGIILSSLLSCKKEIKNQKTTVLQLSVNAQNNTAYVDQTFYMYENTTSRGITFDCNLGYYNTIKSNYTYTIVGSSPIEMGVLDTIGTFILTEQGEIIVNDNPDVYWASLKWGYTCDTKGLKIWN